MNKTSTGQQGETCVNSSCPVKTSSDSLLNLQLYEDAYFGQLPANVGGTLLNLGMAYFRLYDASKAEPLYLR